MKIHLVRFFVSRTIHGTLVVEVGINSRRIFGGGIACIASGGFSLENSRTKNSRRECRLSVLAIPVGASVRACVCSTALYRYSGEKAIQPTKTA